MDFLSKISITCFFASYLVSFLIEISRLFFRARAQTWLMIGATLAGLFAHLVFVGLRMFGSAQPGSYGNWQIWCLLVALVLIGFYLYFVWRKPLTDIGLFLLPMVLMLCAAGFWLDGSNNFSADRSTPMLGMLHGISLLLGTVAVFAGFVCGLMYLIQSARLKAKVARTSRFRLPSLEWLQTANERFLIFSSVMLAAGVVTGMLMNLVGNEGETISWSDPVVWSSLILFGWIVAATVFNWTYKPARRGRKVAYLIVANFLFLVIELVIVLAVQHGSVDVEQTTQRVQQTTQRDWRAMLSRETLSLPQKMLSLPDDRGGISS